MKRKNNKGFTLVEILAAVVIMGILTGVAVPAVTHFIEKSRQKSYEAMEESLKDAAFNYAMNEGLDFDASRAAYYHAWLDSDMLMEEKYLDSMVDPADKSKTCEGFVGIRNDGNDTDDSVNDFKYCIYLKCSRYENDFASDNHGRASCWSSRYAN